MKGVLFALLICFAASRRCVEMAKNRIELALRTGYTEKGHVDGRRMTLYWSQDFPKEALKNVSEMFRDYLEFVQWGDEVDEMKLRRYRKEVQRHNEVCEKIKKQQDEYDNYMKSWLHILQGYNMLKLPPKCPKVPKTPVLNTPHKFILRT